MSEKFRQKGQDFAKFLQSLPESERQRGNRTSFEEAKAEQEEFTEKYKQGICYLCNAPLDSFNRAVPCVHWLLKPKGFGKGDFPAVTKKFRCVQLQSFLRWVANEESFARNINNLPDEGTGTHPPRSLLVWALTWLRQGASPRQAVQDTVAPNTGTPCV